MTNKSSVEEVREAGDMKVNQVFFDKMKDAFEQ